MDRKTAAIMVAILETLNETEGGPESAIYLAMGCNLSVWERYRDTMIAAGWITIAHHWVALTNAGRELCGELAK